MRPRHFLYPLNPKSKQGYVLKDDRNNDYPTSLEGFLDCYSTGTRAYWRVHQASSELSENDYIWVHFALPLSAIMAVGRVREVIEYEPEFDAPGVWIEWDWKLTKRLQEHPIRYASHKQRVQTSVVEANAKTLNVIARWLKDKTPSTSRPTSTPVRFKTVEIEQRQGQPTFRQALMVAYGYQCAVTGCDVRDTLQAAHITPVKKGGHHSVTNGLLLRADIHNLFDRGLLTIDDKYIVKLHPSVRSSAIYKQLHGRKLAVIPRLPADRPSTKRLAKHRKNHISI